MNTFLNMHYECNGQGLNRRELSIVASCGLTTHNAVINARGLKEQKYAYLQLYLKKNGIGHRYSRTKNEYRITIRS